TNPVNKVNAMIRDQNSGLAINKLMSLLVSLLKYGSAKNTMTSDKRNAITVMSIDSLKNWPINCLRREPTALRIPISFARFDERAVLRFIKLIQAISNTITPNIPNSLTYLIYPPTFLPFSKSVYNFHFDMGNNSISGLEACIILSSAK